MVVAGLCVSLPYPSTRQKLAWKVIHNYNRRMGKLTTEGWSRLTAYVEEDTPEGFLERIVTRTVTDKLEDVARSLQVPYSVLWRWLADDPERMAAYRASLEAKADAEAHRAVDIADGATPEDVAVARLRVDTRLKLIGKWGRKQYGDEAAVGGGFGGGIQIVIGALSIPGDKASPGVTIEHKSIDSIGSEVI